MPPPNVTGQLHMGHAMDETWQDILIRYKRMQGYAALWCHRFSSPPLTWRRRRPSAIADADLNTISMNQHGSNLQVLVHTAVFSISHRLALMAIELNLPKEHHRITADELDTIAAIFGSR